MAELITVAQVSNSQTKMDKLTRTASMHNTASMVGWSEKPFVAVSFNYR
jgi:hypothetical protein